MRKGERKRQVLAAAKELIAERGFADVDLDDVADAAEITPGRLARYFDSREALLRAVLNDLPAELFPAPDADDEVVGIGLADLQHALAGGDVLGQHLQAAREVLAAAGHRLAQHLRIGQHEIGG